MHLNIPVAKLLSVLRWRLCFVDSLLTVTPIVGFCVCSMFNCALLCVLSSFTIILIGIRELVALLCLPGVCDCYCLQCLIVVFYGHTQLL